MDGPDRRRRPRVLLLGMGWFPEHPGGLTRYFRGQFEAMSDGSVDPPRAVVIGPVTDGGPTVRAVGRSTQLLPARVFAFARAARREAAAADLIDAHFALYTFPCLFVPRLRRLPLVVHFHGPWADEFVANGARPGLAISAKRRLERYVYRRADAVVVLSEAFKRIVVDEFAVDPTHVHVLTPGADLGHFSPGERSDARAALDVAPSAWVAVTARRLDPRMGVDVLLRAWAQMGPGDRVLLVVGDGPERAALTDLAATLGITGQVRFLGRVGDDLLASCYRAADVSVVPSVALEGFGLVVIEALASGTPVVGTDVGGMAETLRRFDPSLIVPAGDVSALAARLDAARSGAIPLPPAERCRQFAETFSWPEVAERHWLLYSRILAEGGSLGARPRSRAHVRGGA